MKRSIQALIMAGLFAAGCIMGRFVASPQQSAKTTVPPRPEPSGRLGQVAVIDVRPRAPDWVGMCLTDPDYVARSFAFKQWLSERVEVTDKLKRLVDNTETPAATRYYAAKVLGHLGRSGRKVLVKHITWRHNEIYGV